MSSYFGYGSVEEEILADAQYTQREKQVTNIEMVRALLQVAQYFAENAEEGK